MGRASRFRHRRHHQAARPIAGSAAVALIGFFGAAAPAGAAGTTERVSVSTVGVPGNDSGSPAISADGRFVAFFSLSANLVPNDTNGQGDIFLRDRQAGTTERVSVSTGGGQADSASDSAAISADGRFVAFNSSAGNLVPGDTNGRGDIFVRDRRTGRTELVSVGPTGVAEEFGANFRPSLSADGRFVAFSSGGLLVPGDTNGLNDAFVRDRRLGRTERVSVGVGGVQANNNTFRVAISGNGRFAVFASFANNLVPGDTNGTWDIFVRDRQAGATERVSLGAGGAQARGPSRNAVISADGRFVAFTSSAANLVPNDNDGSQGVFVRDRLTGRTEAASVDANGLPGWGGVPAISPGGRYVAFDSRDDLVPRDNNGVYDVYVRDREAGTIERVSVSSAGRQADNNSTSPAISAGGRFVAFDSEARNLVPTGGAGGVFVRNR